MFKKKIFNKIRSLSKIDKIFILVVVLGIIWELFAFYRFPRQSWVDGLLEAWYMTKGLIIYKDFTSQYFPLLYMIMIPFHKIFGFSQVPTMYLAPLWSFSIYIILCVTCVKWLKGWQRILPIIFFLIWDPTLSENHFFTTNFHALINLVIFILWWLEYQKPKKITAILLGLFMSFSFLSSQIVIFFIGAILISLVFRSLKERERKYWQSLILTTIFFSLPSLIVFVWLYKTGALPGFYYWNFTYYFTKIYPFSAYGKSLRDILFYLSIHSPFLLLIPVIIKDKNYLKPQLIFTFFILFSLPITFLFALFYPQRFNMTMPISALFLGLGMKLAGKQPKKRKLTFWVLGLVILINFVTIIYAFIPQYTSYFNRPKENQILDKVKEGDVFWKAEEWVKKNTPQDARLFVTVNALFYFVTDRLPSSSRAASNLPFVYRPIEVFKTELREKPPDYWVIDERNWQRYPNFNCQDVAEFLTKVLNCEPVVARFDYITIRKHVGGSSFCF